MRISESSKQILSSLGLGQILTDIISKSNTDATSRFNAVIVRTDDEKLHCDHGPAIILHDSTSAWLIDGQFHRIGGPALTRNDGLEVWCEHGKVHRIGGPAVILPGGEKSWWEEGQFIEQETVASSWQDAHEILKLER